MATPTPEILRIADEYQRLLRARETKTVSTLTTAYGQVARRLAEQAAQLAEEIARLRALGEAVPAWRVAELARYRSLMEQTQAELARLGEQGERVISQLQREGIRLGARMAEAQVTAMIPAGVRLAFNKLPAGALEAMVGFLQDGSPLARLLLDVGAEAARRIGELLLQGLGMGWNPRKAADMIRREIGMALTRALRIARTEMLRAWRRSSIKGYRDQGTLIKGYRRHARKDSRACIACLLMDGTFYETADDFTDHVQGRCAVIPVTRSWAELGFPDIPDTNAEWQPGRDWFMGQDAATQRAILGNPIYEAWQRGDIGLDDMATLHRSAEWGDSWQASSLTGALEHAGGSRR